MHRMRSDQKKFKRGPRTRFRARPDLLLCHSEAPLRFLFSHELKYEKIPHKNFFFRSMRKITRSIFGLYLDVIYLCTKFIKTAYDTFFGSDK